jgi:hypothetical protein
MTKAISNAHLALYKATDENHLDKLLKSAKNKCYNAANRNHQLIPACDAAIAKINEVYEEVESKLVTERKEARDLAHYRLMSEVDDARINDGYQRELYMMRYQN